MLETDCAIVDENRIDGHRQAVLYTRVSSKDQERGGFSIPAQRQLLRRYAKDRRLDVVAEFSDVETAGRAGRAKFGDMVRHLRTQPNCKVILVEKTDRLYRNLKDWVTLDELGVEVHMVKEGVVLSDQSFSSEKFVHGIKVLVAKNYLDNLSEEVRKGLNEKVRQGHWPARAPVGYQNVVGSEGKKVIVPDPDQAPLVTKLFEWCANDGHTLTELTKMAREAGLVSARTSEPLHRSRIHAILRNPIYMGEFDWKGARYRGAHKPLVSREVWERAQEVLSGRAPRRRARQRHRFTFSGLVHCGICAEVGKRFLLVAELHKGRYVYYRCEECKRRGRASYIREEKISDAFASALSQMPPNEALLDVAAAALNGDMIESDESKLSNLKAELSTLEVLLDMAYEDRLAGRIGPSHFDQRALGWRSQMDALRQEIDELEASAPRTDRARALELQHLVELFRKSENGSQKRRFVEFLYSNSVWRDGKLEVEWKAV
jgi:DNA invertase Pin-like site-specific DNA recombinase